MSAVTGQLRWQCRRGLLELDVLLNRFLEHNYSQLPPQQQAAFSALLQSSDQELIDWLLVRDTYPADPELKEIVLLIQSAEHHT